MNPLTPPANRTQRRFLALWPEADVQHQLVTHAAQWTWPDGCIPYLAEDWHLTLHFIGPVQADRVADIVVLASVPFQPFTLTLDQPTLWPHGLAVLRMSQVSAPLQVLYERLGDVLGRLDLPVDTRPYQPHVTLARRVTAATLPERITPVLWQAHRYVLAVSTGATSPRYRVIHQYE